MGQEKFNEQDVRLTYRFLAHEKETEIRLLDPNKRQAPKNIFIHSEEEFIKVCKEHNGRYNLYAGINERRENGTKEQDVLSIKTIILDIDAVRAKGCEKEAATEEELEEAKRLADMIVTDSMAYSIKPPVKNMSGNGVQLWFAIPPIILTEGNKEDISTQLSLFQKKMQQKFSWIPEYSDPDSNLYNPTHPKAEIDNMGDLPRIIKVIGTLSIKGQNTQDRPYRISHSMTAFARNEDTILRETILDQTLEPEKEPEIICNAEISDTDLPPCVDYILNKHANKDGHGWKRMVSFLAAFYRQLGKPIEETTNIIRAWNQKQPYHEPGEEKELTREIAQVYKKELQCPLCKTLKKTGGYPEAALADMKVCFPDSICKDDKTKGPLGYVYWKKQSEAIEIQNLENIMGAQFGGKKIKLSGSIFRLKKQERVTEVTYECPGCGTIIKMPKPTNNMRCSCGRKTNFKLIGQKVTGGFLITLLNDMTNIASSETMKLFASCKSLGIKINPHFDEKKEIGQVLNKAGKTIQVEGTLITKNRYDKDIQEYIIDKEIEAHNISFIDYLKDFSLTPKKYTYLKEYFSNKEWTDEEIEQTINPEVIGRTRTKKFLLLTALTVKEIAMIGKKKIFGIGRGAIFGDPGEAKSVVCKRFVDTYCEGLNALKITAETLSMAGLKGGVTKDTDDSWVIDWGILPWCHNGLLVMDGYHAFDKQSIASLRETETNNTIDIFKIVKGSRECAYRGIKISNIRQQPIKKFYDTKYDASFDIGFGVQDQENKFDDADRRRVDWIEVYSEEDIPAEAVDTSQFKLLSGEKFELPSEQIKELIKFAWTRSVENIDQASMAALTPLIGKILKDWREQYPGIKLSVLGKEGAIIFSKYVIASAILHFRISEQGIISPDENDIMYVQDLFEDMFEALEINKRIKLTAFDEVLALAIYQKMNEEQKELFHKLGKAGSVTNLCKALGFTRETFYTRFRDKIGLMTPEGYYIPDYSFFNGFYNGLIKVAPISNNGVITELGHLVLRTHRCTLRNSEDLKKNNNLTPSFECQIGESGSRPPYNASTGGDLTNLTCLTLQEGLATPNIEEEEEVEEVEEGYRSVSSVSSVREQSVEALYDVPKAYKNLTPKSECQIVPNQLQQKEAKDIILQGKDIRYITKNIILQKKDINKDIEYVNKDTEYVNKDTEYINIILNILKIQESLTESSIVEQLVGKGMSQEDAFKALDKLAREGEIFQIKPGIWKLV